MCGGLHPRHPDPQSHSMTCATTTDTIKPQLLDRFIVRPPQWKNPCSRGGGGCDKNTQSGKSWSEKGSFEDGGVEGERQPDVADLQDLNKAGVVSLELLLGSRTLEARCFVRGNGGTALKYVSGHDSAASSKGRLVLDGNVSHSWIGAHRSVEDDSGSAAAHYTASRLIATSQYEKHQR